MRIISHSSFPFRIDVLGVLFWRFKDSVDLPVYMETFVN